VKRRRRPAGDDGVRYAPRTPGVPLHDHDADPLASSAPLPPELARPLRALYAARPADAPYWDSLEARIMAAVRGAAATSGAVTGAIRTVPAAAAQRSTLWWQALARWTRPALVAAGVTLVVAGAALVQARASADASRARSAYGAVLGDPYDPSALPLPAADPQLARAFDAYEAEPGDTAGAAEARAARVAAELLSDGLVRRAPIPPAVVDRRARREATFRSLLSSEP
jgi:hypothetical protein